MSNKFNRRDLIKTTSGIAIASALSGSLAKAANPNAPVDEKEKTKMKIQGQPNVIVFFTDQQRWDTTGVHGNPMGLTPNFDRMAMEGTHLYNSFSCQPVCSPARACLQTGLYATEAGVFRNCNTNDGGSMQSGNTLKTITLPSDARTLAHYFGEAGYDTGYIGKWHLANIDPVPKNQRGGYKYWLGANHLEHKSKPYDATLYGNDGKQVKLPGYRVDAMTDAAIRYIDECKNNPFYLFLSYIEPHDPYVAPDGYRERCMDGWIPPDLAALGGNTQRDLWNYYGMVKRIDESLGRIQDALKSLDLTRKTIILFTSDHGCHFATRNGEHKRSCHESSIRVPTAIQGPGFDSGGNIRQLVSTVDLPATLLDAAGIAVPKHMQGHSILPLLKGDTDKWPKEVLIQISESQVGRAIRTDRWKYSVVAPNKDGYRDSGARNYVEEFLYDLDADPYELSNLIGSHRGIASEMRKRLIRRMIEAGEKKPNIKQAKDRMPDSAYGVSWEKWQKWEKKRKSF